MPELSVSRKNIRKLFAEMQGKKFIIPDYQRPYKWDEEKCDTLWKDITNFHLESGSSGVDYFLGAIVICKGDAQSNTIEIIDGQQRITSLLLLLRAFYKKLEKMNADDNITGLKSQIEPCLWDVDPISKKVKDTTKIHIESKVATEKDNNIFHRILKDGEYSEDDKDLYTTNYSFFYNNCEEFAMNEPTQWQHLCVTILERCIVLPIECENLDTALTIFSTLNDRGMPLSDSDIFKAQIYKTKGSNDKNNFTEDWKDLTEKAEDANVSLDDLFRYYSHIIRAKKGEKSKEIGLRKFYAVGEYSRLKENDLITDLKDLADFWISVNKRESKINNVEKINDEAQKYLHCLQCYPNEFLKYITSVFFYKNKDSNDFINTFPEFLKKLTAFLFFKFIEKPTVNAIKDDIYQGIIDVYSNPLLKFEIHLHEDFKTSINNAALSKIAKGIILLHAYQNSNQKSIIPEKFEIEHIFPRIWQDTNYLGWNKEAADEYLEKFGNKVVIEKKINIQAGNGYFGKKKEKYSHSTIEDVCELGRYSKNDWQKDDIEEREKQIVEVLLNFFKNNLM